MKIPRIRVRFRKLGREKAYGQAYADGLIEIDPRQRGEKLLNTLVHELLHIVEPSWSEAKVTRPSNRRAVLSSTVRQPIPSMCIFVPSGIERDAATVRPSTGLRPLAVMPVADLPQQISQAQYAVTVRAGSATAI